MKKRYLVALALSLSLSVLAGAEEATTEAAAEVTTEEAVVTTEADAEDTSEEAESMTEADTEDTSEDVESMTEADTEDTSEEAAEETTSEPVTIGERPDIKMLDFVTLGEYKGLTVSIPEKTVSEEDVESAYDSIVTNYISSAGLYEYVEEGTLKEGDTANIDYTGKKDGVAFDGGTAQGYDLTLGSGTFIPGFEEGLIGVEVGETVEIPLTFPETYHSEELAGQDVIFEVKVNSIRTMPEITDEMASTLSSGECETVEALRERVRELLTESLTTSQDSQIFTQLLQQINENSEIGEVPEELLDYELSINRFYAQQQALSYGMTLDQFVAAYGMTMEQFEQQMRDSLSDTIWQSVLPLAIAEAEEMTLSDEEYQEMVEKLATTNGTDAETYLRFLEDSYPKSFLEMSFMLEKVQTFLKENANIEYTAEEEAAEAEVTEDVTEEAAEEETVEDLTGDVG